MISLAWRQGSVIPKERILPHLQLAVRSLAEEDLILVITQDCDIINPSFEAEPFVEVLIARRTDKANGDIMYGKNPRRIQIACRCSSPHLYEIRAQEKNIAYRRALLGVEPGGPCLFSPEDVRLLARWTGKRYSRQALPTAFNVRIAAIAPKLDKVVKRYGHLITGFWLNIDTQEELPDDRNYRMVLAVTAHHEVLEVAGNEELLIAALQQIEELLSQAGGIQVVQSELKSERDFSLEDIRHSVRWDYDYLSFRAGEVDEPSLENE